MTLRGGESYIGAIEYFVNSKGNRFDGVGGVDARSFLFRGGEGYTVLLKPCYIFKDMMVQHPQAGLGKVTQCMSINDCMCDVQKWFRCSAIDTAHFLDELEEDDRLGYKELVEDVRRRLQDSLAKVRAKRSGIEVTDKMPTGGRGPYDA